jgi:predicted dithiol-disulfide oxidoreductase (DUF899 family)
MTYQDTTEALNGYRQQIGELRKKMRALQETIEPQEVEDYSLQGQGGEVRLSTLFGDKDHLFVIHNMGAGCPYCTLWADGLNGILGHLENRAAVVVCSPDSPEQQRKFAQSRNWGFRMLSYQDSGFAEDMGYRSERGWMPGVSVLTRRDGKLVRVSNTEFGPGDDFCALWHLLDMIPEGAAGWQPRYRYDAAA